MNEKTLIFALCLPLLALGLTPLLTRLATAATYADVTVVDAKAMIDSNPSLVLLDVRNLSEYELGHIRNAKLIPLPELDTRLNELNKSDEILVYCKLGGRSTTASQILGNNSFLHVYNMIGGMIDWIRLEYPAYVNYASIQQAIDNATDGDAIYVASGRYQERLSVNKPISIFGENRDTTTIDGTANGTIFDVKADNVSISDFTITYCGCGCKEYAGVYVEEYHQNINVTNNILVSDGIGIKLVKASKVIIAHNNITRNTDTPINITDSSNILVQENIIENNLDGIEAQNSTDSIFSNNNIFKSVNGISLLDSNNNTIFGNNVSSNVIYGCYISRSNDNSIFLNSFQGNGYHVSIHDSNNSWDNGFEGNFWSNYTGNDTNLDGIGDTPQFIETNNIDNHPLMGIPYTFRTILNQQVDFISNSSISDFNFSLLDASRAALTCKVNGENGTQGFCRIRVPKTLINGSYEVYLDGEAITYPQMRELSSSNMTFEYLYINYTHSEHTIEVTGTTIITEFASLLLMPLFMIAALLAAVVYRKRSSASLNK